MPRGKLHEEAAAAEEGAEGEAEKAMIHDLYDYL